mgnify:FL=1
MGVFTVPDQTTQNGKVGYGHIWTGHHKRNSERISEIADFSLFGASTPPWSAEVAPTHELNYGGFYQYEYTQRNKGTDHPCGMTMQEVVDLLSDEYGWSDSVSNLSAKLQRESIRYKEVLELAAVLGYDIVWQKRREK